ncbi:unnamed protein product [Linum trigynum]|uniref:Expansin-like EG45 domain-containing protein n=1 Tax=Linum trigynum TaxID=586398 RepID=A0AAV2EHM4_9ROSI
MARNQSSLLLISLLLLLSSSSVSLATPVTAIAGFTNARHSKQACTDEAPAIAMFAGVNSKLYGNGDICWIKFSITCIGGVAGQSSPCRTSDPVDVTVTDSCSPESDNKPCPTFVLSEKAFALIANPQAGFATISYDR